VNLGVPELLIILLLFLAVVGGTIALAVAFLATPRRRPSHARPSPPEPPAGR
jgi:hypothetical protein